MLNVQSNSQPHRCMQILKAMCILNRVRPELGTYSGPHPSQSRSSYHNVAGKMFYADSPQTWRTFTSEYKITCHWLPVHPCVVTCSHMEVCTAGWLSTFSEQVDVVRSQVSYASSLHECWCVFPRGCTLVPVTEIYIIHHPSATISLIHCHTSVIYCFTPRTSTTIVISMPVCLYDCSPYLRNHMAKLQCMFCAHRLWLWHSPLLAALWYVMYFQF